MKYVSPKIELEYLASEDVMALINSSESYLGYGMKTSFWDGQIEGAEAE